MEDAEFNYEYKMLHALTGDWDFVELFMQTYLEILDNVKDDTDDARRRNHLKKLKEIALFQSIFAYDEYDRQIEAGLNLEPETEPEGQNLK